MQQRVVALVLGPELLGADHALGETVWRARVVQLESAHRREPRVLRQNVVGQLGEQPAQ